MSFSINLGLSLNAPNKVVSGQTSGPADPAVLSALSLDVITGLWTVTTNLPLQGAFHWARYPEGATNIGADGNGGWSLAPLESGVVAADAAVTLPTNAPDDNLYTMALYQRVIDVDSNVITVVYQETGGVSAPVFITQPSLQPDPAHLGDTVTLDLGSANEALGYEIDHFSLDGIDKRAELIGNQWDSTGAQAGSLTLQTRAIGPGGSTLSNIAALDLLHAAPAVTGALTKQSFIENTGIQIYDVSGAFAGSALVYTVQSGPAGVTVNSAGAVSFDTDMLLPQSGTSIIIRATNSGGSVETGFSLSIVEAANWSLTALSEAIQISSAPAVAAPVVTGGEQQITITG